MFIKEENSILEMDSGISGKTTVIMSGVHGNELSGVKVMLDLYSKIKVIKGKVIFIFANLKALELNNRVYQKNMNRCFLKNNKGQKYEDKRAKEIMNILDNSDYLLDIHNTINKENSIPFLISEYDNLGKYFNVNFSVKGFDELHPGGSDSYMNKIGKIGLCLESGSIYDKNGVSIAQDGLINFLKYTGNIEGDAIKYINNQTILFNEIYKNKSFNFSFVKKFKDFEQLKKGDLIAYDDGVEIIAKNDGYIVFAYNPKKIGEECFCFGKRIKKDS